MSAPHGFLVDRLGVWSDPVAFAVDRDQTVAYAEATNDRTPSHLFGTVAPPVFAIVAPFSIMADTTLYAVPDELIMRILHGEQDMRFHRPIVAGDQLSCRAKVMGIEGKSSGVVVTTLVETRDAADALVNEQYFSGFFRGGKLDARVGEPAPDHAFPEELREREPDAVVVEKFDEDQTHRYSAASGDLMPIHLDDDMAKAMGLPGIIIHGLCTMAFASHALIGHVCPDNPEKLTRLAVRFSAPAQPKHTISTRIWDREDGLVSFETVTDDGVVVIKDGLAEFAL